MDVRSIEESLPLPMHHGTTPVWWLWEPRELKEASLGGYLELIGEFVVEAGGHVAPHSHHTHEFYYLLGGRAIMTIEDEERELVPGDAVHIPPDKVHSIRPASPNASIRSFVFAIGLPGTPEYDYAVN
jgi:quercetin dioxygenase-like cupin family protein